MTGPSSSRRATPGRVATQLVVPVLAVAAFLLGWNGVNREPGAGSTFDQWYRAMQLFVLDGGALDHIGMNPYLQVARFFAPIVTVAAVLLGLRALFADALRRRRIALMRGHSVVCGDTPEARALARNIRDRKEKVVLVANESVPMPDRVPVVVGDPQEVETMRAAGISRARAIYALTTEDTVNVAVALGAGNVDRRSTGRLAGYAGVREGDLTDLLKIRLLATTGRSDPTIDFFNPVGVAARLLVEQHAPIGARPAIVGSGDVFNAVVAAVRGTGRNRDDHHHGFRAIKVGGTSPRLDEARLAKELHGGGQAYVCMDTDQATVTIALRLVLARPDVTVIVCVRRRSAFARLISADSGVTLFGLDEASMTSAIEQGSLGQVPERVARRIHDNYRFAEFAQGRTEKSNPSTVPWEKLPDRLQRSNVAQALNISAALGDVGIVLTGREAPATPFTFTTAERDHLAESEHRRWMKERIDAGVVHGETRTPTTHPDLIEWADLGPEARKKDYATVDQLPDLLAAEGLYLTRPAQ